MRDDGDEMVEAEVSVADLARHCDPFDGGEWDCDPIPRDQVLDCVEHGEFEFRSWQVVNSRRRAEPLDDVAFHIRRLAYLYANPDPRPLDIGMEGHKDAYGDYRRVRLFDGSHRLGAAILRREETVRVTVMEWELETMQEFLPTLQLVGAEPVPATAC